MSYRTFKTCGLVLLVLATTEIFSATAETSEALQAVRAVGPEGGWPKDYDMLAVLTPDQKATVAIRQVRKFTCLVVI